MVGAFKTIKGRINLLGYIYNENCKVCHDIYFTDNNRNVI